jgi:hypothetical protein
VADYKEGIGLEPHVDTFGNDLSFIVYIQADRCLRKEFDSGRLIAKRFKYVISKLQYI